jgi:glycosyltransferase involved in cell wall biosynthesis
MKPKVVVVMPAYNAAKTLEKTYHDLPKHIVDHIILVDDVSQDDTVNIARNLGLQVVIHLQNKGYGGNQKTCYIEALREGADIVVMLHPDYQYDSKLVPELIQPILDDSADFVLGSRFLGGGALAGGMPLWKYIANRFLTICMNIILGLSLSEYHTGFRAYRREVLATAPFLLNSDGFVFDTEFLVEACAYGFRLTEIPVPTRYFPEASSVDFRQSVIYGLSTLLVLVKFILNRFNIYSAPQFNRKLADIISPYHLSEIKQNRNMEDVSD